MHKIKRFIRRWRFCCMSPFVVKPKAMVWKAEDAVSVNQFLQSTSGIKLLTAVDDVVFNAVFKGGDNNTDIVNGMIDIRDYILGLGSPDIKILNPRLDEDD